MKIAGNEVKVALLYKNKRVLAWSLGKSEEEAINQLKKVAKFHRIEGKIEINEEKFKEMLEKGKIPTGLEQYRFARVYEELLKVPKGKTITYGELAKRANAHVRQVIFALKFNPFPILIPCHRVVAKNELGGYTPLGKEFKKRLLEKEKD